jgi:hypothetical protein
MGGPQSGIFMPKDELPGLKVVAPQGLGPPAYPDSPWIELIPGSGVWSPKSDFPKRFSSLRNHWGPPTTRNGYWDRGYGFLLSSFGPPNNVRTKRRADSRRSPVHLPPLGTPKARLTIRRHWFCAVLPLGLTHVVLCDKATVVSRRSPEAR